MKKIRYKPRSEQRRRAELPIMTGILSDLEKMNGFLLFGGARNAMKEADAQGE